MTEETSQEQKVETSEEKGPITKDMMIGDVVGQYPQAAEVFTKYGLHCVGCHVSPVETVEQGAMGHGMPADVLDKMVAEANKVIAEGGPVEAHKPAEPVDLDKMDLTVTDTAINKLLDIMKQEKKEGHYFRIAVMPGGCSGFSYHFDLEEKPKDDDVVKEKGGLKVVVDPGSLEMLNGASIDYIDSMQGSGFKVDNPNATSSCGCGNSFQ